MKEVVRNRLFGILLLALFSLPFFFDDALVRAVHALRNPFFDIFFFLITYFGSVLIVLFLSTSVLLWNRKKKRWIVPLWLSLAVSFLITLIIKAVFFRQRPFLFGLSAPDILTASLMATSSFPSTHAAAAFSAVPLLDREFPRLKAFWILFAAAVAFSRVYFGLHYVSDILAGAAIGYFVGMVFFGYEEKKKISAFLEKIFPKKRGARKR